MLCVVQVPADADLVLSVKLSNTTRGRGDINKCPARLFPRAKQYGWWLVVADLESGDLLAMKRVMVR